MTLNKDHIGGLVFLCLAVFYGYHAHQIPLLPGDEFESFHAQTLPNALAWMAGILSIALIVAASIKQQEDDTPLSLVGYQFKLVASLLVLVILFGIALPWLGFAISTILFLMGGYGLLGVNSVKTLILASVPFALGLWFILSQLLDIYLAPGRLFTMILGS